MGTAKDFFYESLIINKSYKWVGLTYCERDAIYDRYKRYSLTI